MGASVPSASMNASSKKCVGLLLPGPEPGLVEGVHQLLDIGLGEAAAEVPGGGRVGDALGPEGVEVDLVVAPDFEVLQAAAAGQEVVGDVQDVVALVSTAGAASAGGGPRSMSWTSPSFRARRWMAPMPPGAMARVRSAIS